MSNNGPQFNVTKWLQNNVAGSKVSNTVKTPNINLGKSNSSTAGSKASTIGQILAYILAIGVVIMVILLFINYFITPIFRLQPGGPGIIPVPGFDDGKLFWSNTNPGQILNKDLPIVSQYYGYTINLDVFVENPLQFAKTPRIFFSRGAVRREKPTGDTILGALENYNLVAALLPDTNDLIVSVLNKDNNMENIIIPNVPVQEPFRLTMVVMQQALEVYINGRLIKTRKFLSEPRDTKGDIYPAAGIEINAIKVHNLKIWSRILSASEIRDATPKLSSAKDFGAGPMPSSTSCVSSAINGVTNEMGDSLDRLSKLSV
jgi:hypothetical protein